MKRGFRREQANWRRPAVDPKTFELAEAFMAEVVVGSPDDDDKWELAARIQEIIEDYCREVEERP
jgi:hypothetical protein